MLRAVFLLFLQPHFAYEGNPFLEDKSIPSDSQSLIKDEANQLVYLSDAQLKTHPLYLFPPFEGGKRAQSAAFSGTRTASPDDYAYEQSLAASKPPPTVTVLAQSPSAQKAERRLAKILSQLSFIESYVYKNALKEYELLCLADTLQLETLQAYQRVLERVHLENVGAFGEKLLEVLADAEQKEKERLRVTSVRVKMNLRERAEARAKALEWLQRLSNQKQLAPHKAIEIKAFILNHEKKFGIEFEETYDLFVILASIARL